MEFYNTLFYASVLEVGSPKRVWLDQIQGAAVLWTQAQGSILLASLGSGSCGCPHHPKLCLHGHITNFSDVPDSWLPVSPIRMLVVKKKFKWPENT
jgi:hypothetical protein